MIVYSVVASFMRNVNDPLPAQETETRQLTFNGKVIKKANVFRKEIVESKYCTPCSVHFWNNKLDICLDKAHWSNARSVTKESRLRELQWKVLHNIYPTNILLHKMQNGAAINKK